MDEATVRRQAEAHAAALASGDLAAAGADLAREARAQAGEVMAALPRPLRSGDVAKVVVSEDRATVHIRYSGDDREATVESVWAERDGRPKIVELRVV